MIKKNQQGEEKKQSIQLKDDLYNNFDKILEFELQKSEE